MNNYETVAILKKEVVDKADDIILKYKNLINNIGGKVNETENLGIKKLAYDIKGNSEGLYMLIKFEGESGIITELERNYRIDEDVLKFITVRQEY